MFCVHGNINIVISFLISLSQGAESFLSAVRIRPAVVCGEAHCYGDDEVCSCDTVVSFLCVSCEGLYFRQHPTNQQPFTAAGGGALEPQCAAHPQKRSLIHC